jgi:hypothetical protein
MSEPLPLDPKPWLAWTGDDCGGGGHLGDRGAVSDSYKDKFKPREGYEQDRAKYPDGVSQ